MTQKSLLITGGSGFFGRALLRYISLYQKHNEYKVYILTRSLESFAERNADLLTSPNIQVINSDILDSSTLPWHVRFTHVIHAACESRRAENIQLYHNITQGTRNILELAAVTGVERFLYISSGAVYHQLLKEASLIDETADTNPVFCVNESSYGVAKRSAEYICDLYAKKYDMKVIKARCFTFSGIDMPIYSNYAICNFVRDALYADSITIVGDGRGHRSYMDQSDLSKWLFALLERAEIHNTYNVGSNMPISISELSCLVRDLVAPRKPIRILERQSSEQRGRDYYIPNIERIVSSLNLSMTVTLKESILRMAAHYSVTDISSTK